MVVVLARECFLMVESMLFANHYTWASWSYEAYESKPTLVVARLWADQA